MNAEQILLDWLFPLLDPLTPYFIPAYLRQPVYIHHEAVSKFTQAVTTLTEHGARIFEGAAANAFVTKTEQYLHSEMLFTGAGTGSNAGAMEEAAKSYETLAQELLAAAERAGLELSRDAVTFQIVEITVELVTLAAVAQGFIDIPIDILAGILDTGLFVVDVLEAIEKGVAIKTLTEFFIAVYEAIQKWQRQIQNIANQPLPSLPLSPLSLTEPSPYLVRVSVPVTERLEEIQQNVEELMVIDETPVVWLEIEQG